VEYEEEEETRLKTTRPVKDEVIDEEKDTGIIKTQIPAIVKELRAYNLPRVIPTMAAAPRRRFGR